MARKYTLLNSNLKEDDERMLKELMTESGHESRSAFVRYLIRKEYKRLHQETPEQDKEFRK